MMTYEVTPRGAREKNDVSTGQNVTYDANGGAQRYRRHVRTRHYTIYDVMTYVCYFR